MASQIAKLKGTTAGGVLSLTVTKSGGPMVTRALVGSTGNDDCIFDDAQLTPGPATMPLQPANSYSVVWMGAFVAAGTAVLDVVVDHASGGPQSTKKVKVSGQTGDSFWRLVIVR